MKITTFDSWEEKAKYNANLILLTNILSKIKDVLDASIKYEWLSLHNKTDNLQNKIT